jgi:hypothetical protein
MTKEQRLFQEFATLDLISHGRSEIVAGRVSCPFGDFAQVVRSWQRGILAHTEFTRLQDVP